MLAVPTLAQCPSELKKYTTGFKGFDSRAFSFLDDALTNVRLVGYGEDTHGTAEFTLLAEKLMAYLSDTHGFTAFIIETGFGEGQYLNDYVQGKRDDLGVILDDHNSTWRYRTQEFHQLMKWLRAHNQNHSQKIHVYGSEMQFVISDINRLKTYLISVDSDFELTGFEKHLWQEISDSEKIAYFTVYMNLKKHFIDNSETFRQKTSDREFELAYHHVDVLGQFVTAVNQSVEQRKHDFRDIYISENIQWALDFHGDQTKGLYWAHNAHVGDWVSNGIVDVAGHQLRKLYGNAYFNIATDFGTGAYLAFSRDWKMDTFGHDTVLEDTFSACLKNNGEPNAFINFRAARDEDRLTAFFDSDLITMSGAGAQVRTRKTESNGMASAFDGVLYLDRTTPITVTE
ncbi:MAG: erythromycin esterase family protein [Pseudomonadota bacterium]